MKWSKSNSKIVKSRKKQRKKQRKREWHRWFAWRPVVFTGTDDRVWLEFILRRLDVSVLKPDIWEYKEISE